MLLCWPNLIKIIKFNKNSKYDKELNNFPNSIETLKLPEKYSLKIKNIPKGFKKIILSKNYNYINDFKNYNLEIY